MRERRECQSLVAWESSKRRNGRSRRPRDRFARCAPAPGFRRGSERDPRSRNHPLRQQGGRDSVCYAISGGRRTSIVFTYYPAIDGPSYRESHGAMDSRKRPGVLSGPKAGDRPNNPCRGPRPHRRTRLRRQKPQKRWPQLDALPTGRAIRHYAMCGMRVKGGA